MIKFGTGGWRAIIADGFTKENLQIVCTALAQMIHDENKADKPIVIGYDRRFLSEEAAHWAVEILASHNIKCNLIHKAAPTPLVMFYVKDQNLDYGMAITASHNPAIYNGVKIFTKGGRDADQDTTINLEKYIEKLEQTKQELNFTPYKKALEHGLVTEFDPHNEYIDSILALVDTKAIKNANLKIALDPMYGVSQTSLRTILSETRSELLVIHDRHDTLFGGRLPAPNKQTLGILSNFVVEKSCDLGVATDGDADRIGVIDENGEFVDPNKLLIILYYYLLKYKGLKGDCVRNNSTTHLLDKMAKTFGQTCHEVPVGFKHISSKMEASDAIIGGESSGGLTVKGHILGKDGIYAAVLLAELIAVTKKRLSELYKEITDAYGEVFYYDTDFKLEDFEAKEALRQKIYIEKAMPNFPFEIEKISYTDGCKVYFKNDGFVIARFSGTEPLLRIASEMNTLADAQKCVELFKQVLSL